MRNNNEGQEDSLELPLFSLSTLVTATDNFAFNRKLGEGGFGSVYKVKFLSVSKITVNINETLPFPFKTSQSLF